jgi:acetyl-CoA C-acetyltransferase
MLNMNPPRRLPSKNQKNPWTNWRVILPPSSLASQSSPFRNKKKSIIAKFTLSKLNGDRANVRPQQPALVLMRLSEAEKRGLQPLARIVGHASHSQEPEWFTTAPVGALNKLFATVGWGTGDVDLFEINEAFAPVTMAAMKELKLPHDKVNVHGGACALGHPVGASGARLLVTLLAALEKYDQRRGVASLCIGGGEAVAMAVERLG